jgi:hypothetical protein
MSTMTTMLQLPEPEPFSVKVTFTLTKENVKFVNIQEHYNEYFAILEFLRSQRAKGWNLEMTSVVES